MFDTRHQISCVIQNIYKKDVGYPRKEVSDEEYRVTIEPEEEALPLLVEERNFH